VGLEATSSVADHQSTQTRQGHKDACLCWSTESRAATSEYDLKLGLARTIHLHGVYTVLLAGKSPNIRSYTVYIHDCGQPNSEHRQVAQLTAVAENRRTA